MVEPLASDSWSKTPAKKNTRRWCKGKVGREHVYEFRLSRWPYVRKMGCYFSTSKFKSLNEAPDRWVCHHERYCVNCGKIDWKTPFVCPDRKES